MKGLAGTLISATASGKRQSRLYLVSLVGDLQQTTSSYLSYPQFDRWHQDVCQRLCEIYYELGYPQFSVGQTPKWINMTFKYLFALGEKRIAGS